MKEEERLRAHQPPRPRRRSCRSSQGTGRPRRIPSPAARAGFPSSRAPRPRGRSRSRRRSAPPPRRRGSRRSRPCWSPARRPAPGRPPRASRAVAPSRRRRRSRLVRHLAAAGAVAALVVGEGRPAAVTGEAREVGVVLPAGAGAVDDEDPGPGWWILGQPEVVGEAVGAAASLRSAGDGSSIAPILTEGGAAPRPVTMPIPMASPRPQSGLAADGRPDRRLTGLPDRQPRQPARPPRDRRLRPARYRGRVRNPRLRLRRGGHAGQGPRLHRCPVAARSELRGALRQQGDALHGDLPAVRRGGALGRRRLGRRAVDGASRRGRPCPDPHARQQQVRGRDPACGSRRGRSPDPRLLR